MGIEAPRTIESIRDRLLDTRRRIAEAARRAGRAPDDVELVLVTKGQSAEVVRAAYAAGARHFGENRVEELGPKLSRLADLDGAVWHMVGHLQSRKVKDLPRETAMVHSVDRLKAAERLDEWAARRGRPLEILLECNVTGEPTKAGWPAAEPDRWDDNLSAFEAILGKPNLSTLGLMTMAPLGAAPDAIRTAFSRLRDLRSYLERRLAVTWPHLSMGMTDDFEIAVEEGATLVRVGRAILGEGRAG
jgi:PLP dependent protein